MQEIELKILDIDKKNLIQKLKSKKAVKTYKGLMKIAYFDQEDSRIKKADELLRLRDIGNGKVEITYKSSPQIKDGCKVYDELETLSENFDMLCEIFEKAGLKKTMYYEKKRIQYEYKNVKFEIDTYPKIPTWVELEVKNPKIIKEILKEFELQNHETSNLTCTKLFEIKYQKVKLNGLKF